MAASLLTFAAAEDADVIVLGTAYTRDEIVALASSEGEYTYMGSGGERTDTVRGVLLEVLLAEVADDAVVEFTTIDEWAGIAAYSKTKAELVELNAILAYQIKNGDEWQDYTRTQTTPPGQFALYMDGERPGHAISSISLGSATEQPGTEPGGPGAAPDSWIGDATPDEYDFCIVGLVEEPAFFTTAGFAEFAAEFAQTKEYNWLNSSASRDTDTFTGVYFTDLLSEIVKPLDSAGGVIVTADDGFNRSFSLSDAASPVFAPDIDGNLMMFAFNGTDSRTNREIIDFALPRLVVGQRDVDDVNRSSWVNGIVEIRVTAFSDLGRYSWAAEAIDALVAAGVITGQPGGGYDPAGSMDRAMAVTILGRVMNPDWETATVVPGDFPDVEYDSWYGVHVSWAVEQGIVRGYPDGTFKPDNLISVEHMILLMQNAGLTEVPEGIDQSAVRDANRAELAFITYMLAVQLGIL